MPKFKSYLGKSVYVKGGIVVFDSETIETTDAKQVDALRKAKNVEEVKQAKKVAAKSAD